MQVDGEVLSVVYACSKLHYYIFGEQVTVYNAHKPLEDIFKKNNLHAYTENAPMPAVV